MIKMLKQLFCKHEPFQYMALNDTDSILVCKKCYKNYKA